MKKVSPVLTSLLIATASLTTAAAPTVRTVPRAEVVVHLPRTDRLAPVVKFLTAAGRHSAMLRPDSWARELLPGLEMDVRDVAGLEAKGVDTGRPLTSSFFGSGKVTCLWLKDPARFEKAARASLEGYGPLWKDKTPGVFGVHVEGQLVYGVVIRKKEACVADDTDGVQPRLQQAVRALTTAPTRLGAFDGLTGEAFVLAPGKVALALTAEGDTLRANGLTLGDHDPRLSGAGPSAFAALKLSGIAVARTRVHPESSRYLARKLDSQLAAACPSCDRKLTGELVFALSKHLSGDVALRVDRIQVVGTLRTAASRFFAVKQAGVARLGSLAAARKLLEGMKAWPHARATDRGYSLKLEGGEVELGISGNNLFFGNDAQAVTNLLQELPPAATAMAHGAVIDLDPKLVNKAFGQVSMLDLMSSRELAAVVAVGIELGPLFAHSKAVSLWADSAAGKKHRFQLQWTLDAGAARP
ncbi:MAG: hypothetical protein M3Y59_04680 [Myxococcota bacterium]|nr:hypothetical protein [Myxococcota bacterium]